MLSGIVLDRPGLALLCFCFGFARLTPARSHKCKANPHPKRKKAVPSGPIRIGPAPQPATPAGTARNQGSSTRMNQAPRLQDLPRTAALLCLEVERFCLHDLALPRGSSLVLALSGGADSTALALILTLLAPRLNLTLHGLSINHGLRPEAADDAAHAQSTCRTLGIPCAVRKADVQGFAARCRMGEEEAGRALRYALLEEERQAVDARFIALGHHREDLSEDILLRLVRGTGWPALGGMPARDDNRRLLRPLLHCCPSALKDLLRHCGFDWCEDASNQSTAYRRNRLRLQVLPLLRAENPALDRTLGHMRQLADLDRAYWQQTLDEALRKNPWHMEETPHAGQTSPNEPPPPAALTLPRALLRALPAAARLRLYMRAVQQLCSAVGMKTESEDGPHCENETPQAATSGQARAATLLALDQALEQGRGNTRFQLPGGIEAHLKGGGIRFYRSGPPAHAPGAPRLAARRAGGQTHPIK